MSTETSKPGKPSSRQAIQEGRQPNSQPTSQPINQTTAVRGHPQKPRYAVQENTECHSPRSTEACRPGKPSRQASQPGSPPASRPANQPLNQTTAVHDPRSLAEAAARGKAFMRLERSAANCRNRGQAFVKLARSDVRGHPEAERLTQMQTTAHIPNMWSPNKWSPKQAQSKVIL